MKPTSYEHSARLSTSPGRRVYEEYRKATEARAVAALAATYVAFTPEQEAAQQRYFDNANDLKVTIADVDAVIVGRRSRRELHPHRRLRRRAHGAQVRLTKKVQGTPEGWRLAAGK